METLIGIYASPGEYASRLAEYINSRRDVGCGGICFHNNSELDEFLKSGALSILLTDDPNHFKIYNKIPRVCLLCEEKEKCGAAGTGEVFFKYLRAPVLLQRLFPALNRTFEKNSIYTVFSPSSNAAARRFAKEKAAELAKVGRTLLLLWDPFGSTEGSREEGVSLSELLFAARKNRRGFGDMLDGTLKESGYSCIKGTDHYADLWQFSPEEMQELVEMCKTEGNFESIVFECGFMSESMERLMEMSDRVFLPKADEADPGPDEFLRQMKYAGKQEILLKVRAENEQRT